MKTVIFTNTLSLDLMSEIEKYKTQKGLTKREIFETALRKFFIDEKKKMMAKSFKKAKNDYEIQEMSEWGLKDYLYHL